MKTIEAIRALAKARNQADLDAAEARRIKKQHNDRLAHDRFKPLMDVVSATQAEYPLLFCSPGPIHWMQLTVTDQEICGCGLGRLVIRMASKVYHPNAGRVSDWLVIEGAGSGFWLSPDNYSGGGGSIAHEKTIDLMVPHMIGLMADLIRTSETKN